MVVGVFCTALFSLCHATWVHKNNRLMQLHFLMLPPCDCITKIANNFMKGPTFGNQMTIFGEIGNSFFRDGEKRDMRCWSKVGDGEVGV